MNEAMNTAEVLAAPHVNKYATLNAVIVTAAKALLEHTVWAHRLYEYGKLALEEQIVQGAPDDEPDNRLAGFNVNITDAKRDHEIGCLRVRIDAGWPADIEKREDGSTWRTFRVHPSLTLSKAPAMIRLPDNIDSAKFVRNFVQEQLDLIDFVAGLPCTTESVCVMTAEQAAKAEAERLEREANEKILSRVRNIIDVSRRGLRVGRPTRVLPADFVVGLAPGRYDVDFDDYPNRAPKKTYRLYIDPDNGYVSVRHLV